MQKVLFIGQTESVGLAAALRKAGYTADCAAAGEAEATAAFERLRPDLLVLELGDDALLLQHVRRILRTELNAHPIPLLALARRVHLSPAQIVVGVDDFLLPPYDASELLARVQMALWRVKRINSQRCIEVGSLRADLAARTVSVNDQPIALTPREYDLLVFLMTHRCRVFTREALTLQVWGYEFEGEPRVVDATIKRVRSRLPKACRSLIETVWGVGYRFGESTEPPPG